MDDNKKYLFRACTLEGYCIKTLVELLQFSIKTACYEIDSKGISLRMEDTKKHSMFLVDLAAENFYSYRFDSDKICFGINHVNLYNMLKSVKKKDMVTLFISRARPSELGIRIEPKEKTKVITSSIRIYPAHNVYSLKLPEGSAPDANMAYIVTYPILSGDYTKTCKELARLSRNINVAVCETGMVLETMTESVYSKSVMIGDVAETCAREMYTSEYMCNIAKVSGMSQVIYVSQLAGHPLKIRANVGGLGTVVVYIKSNNQIDLEESVVEIMEI